MAPLSFAKGLYLWFFHRIDAQGPLNGERFWRAKNGVTAFYLNHARQIYGLGLQKYGPDSDQTELLQMFEEWSGAGRWANHPRSKRPQQNRVQLNFEVFFLMMLSV